MVQFSCPRCKTGLKTGNGSGKVELPQFLVGLGIGLEHTDIAKKSRLADAISHHPCRRTTKSHLTAKAGKMLNP